jgi:hypothetical protein
VGKAMKDSGKTVKVWFTTTSSEEMMKKHPFYKPLSDRYDVVLTEDCDYLFVDYKDYVFSKEFLKHDCVRIFYSPENISPDLSLVDYAICPNYVPCGDRFLWMPFYWFSRECWSLVNEPPKASFDDWRQRDGFCCFVVSNPAGEPSLSKPPASMREVFFDSLSAYKQVSSAGKFRQNVPPITVDETKNQTFYQAKIDFMRRYRFALTFENSSAYGYTSEKIVHAFLAGCIPIYWGDPLIDTQFDKDSFIWIRDEDSVEEGIETIRKIDENTDLARKYFSHANKYLDPFEKICRQEYLDNFLENIVTRGPKKALRRSRYFLTREYEKRVVNGLGDAIDNDDYESSRLDIPLSDFFPHASNVEVKQGVDDLTVEIKHSYKGYIQTFGGRFNIPPPRPFLVKATIPELAQSLSLKLKYESSIPVVVTLLIMQYDATTQLKNDFKETDENASGEISISSKIAKDAQSYKFAIRLMRPDKSDNPFTVRLSGISPNVIRKRQSTELKQP